LSDDFPQMDYVQVEKEKPKAKAGKSSAKKSKASETASSDDERQWQPTQGERNKLAWMLENQHVFLTQYFNVPDQQNYILYSEKLLYHDGWRQYIPAVSYRRCRPFA